MGAKPQLLRNFMQRRNAGVALPDLSVSCSRLAVPGMKRQAEMSWASAALHMRGCSSKYSARSAPYENWHRAHLRAVSPRGSG